VITLDSDDDGDYVEDVNDTFPLDGSEWEDTDNDNIGNNADLMMMGMVSQMLMKLHVVPTR